MKLKRAKKTVDNGALAKEIVGRIDLPFKRYVGWKWLHHYTPVKSEDTRLRLEFYAKKLLDMGMDHREIGWMFSDIGWDIFTECFLNRTFEKTKKDDIYYQNRIEPERSSGVVRLADLPPLP